MRLARFIQFVILTAALPCLVTCTVGHGSTDARRIWDLRPPLSTARLEWPDSVVGDTWVINGPLSINVRISDALSIEMPASMVTVSRAGTSVMSVCIRGQPNSRRVVGESARDRMNTLLQDHSERSRERLAEWIRSDAVAHEDQSFVVGSTKVDALPLISLELWGGHGANGDQWIEKLTISLE